MNHSVSEANKEIVLRFVGEAINEGRLDVLPEIYPADRVPAVEAWIAPFRASFPDVHMEVVDLIAEGDKVVGRFRCSGTHLGLWRGHAPTGRRFENVDEVYIFEIRGGRIIDAWGLEDSLTRLQQLGFA